MAYICGLKQRIYAELFDTLFQGTGNLGVQQSNELFMRTNAGSHLTNMTGQGQLASDNTFVILAMAATDIFYTLRNGVDGTITRTAASPASMSSEDVQFSMEQYQLLRKQLLLTLMVGEKPEWQGWFDSCPAAQGLDGAVSVSSSGTSAGLDIGQVVMNNGVPSYDSLLRFAKPAIISPRQQFKVLAQFAVQTTNANATPNVTPNIVDYLNAANVSTTVKDYKSCTLRLLGTLLRHVL